MKNVVLLGDTIRYGYEKRVEELLGDDVKIYTTTWEHCRFTKYVLWGVPSWMAGWEYPKIDLIHWNTGIWDLYRCADGKALTPLDVFLKENTRLAYQMETYCDNLIWATITPGGAGLDRGEPVNPFWENPAPGADLTAPMEEWNSDVCRYNEATAKMLSARGIHINDLYSVIAADTDRYIAKDGIHPTEDGYEALAQKVAAEISARL